MTQVEKIPEWAAGVDKTVDISDTPIKVGTTFTNVYKLEGKQVTAPHLVTALEPPRRWELKIWYAAVAITTWHYESEGSGTKVWVTVDYSFGEKEQRAVDKELQFLKEVLETGKIPDASRRGKD